MSPQVSSEVSLDFRNTNSLWASVAVETLVRLGLETVIVCPGSRSTPLTYAFARHPSIEALPILDERSAAFFALGAAKRQHRPVALVCTSGTAGANFYPAVIEAYESGMPLLVFTADRPPEMRDCASGQTIDQQKLYGGFTKQFSELSVPVASVEMLSYLRQTLVSAWGRAIAPFPGPIHFNCPFRDPLPPIPDGTTESLKTTFNADFFFSKISPKFASSEVSLLPIEQWLNHEKGLIIAGPTTPKYPKSYCQAISNLASLLGWPVLAEGLSPLRNHTRLNPSLISTYDAILRDSSRADGLIPQGVIQLGPLPISKVLRQWLQTTQPERWIIGSQRNLDPLHGPTHYLATNISCLGQLKAREKKAPKDYTKQWLANEHSMRQKLDTQLTKEDTLVESKVVWLLSQYLPEKTPLFIANSMPVRDVEYFWRPNNRQVEPVFSRGANGIDGTISTAMGLAHHNRPSVLLTGDLAFLHDTNGLLNVFALTGSLTIVVINNRGGGIFEMLPISQFEPEFETYFVTPQRVDFGALCSAYGVEYQQISHVQDLIEGIEKLPEKGVKVLEVMCDRKQSVQQRKSLLNSL
ncbi:MAG: 2-succinyl-5-enolpyruvyl-6-hydroxy-3-cyclohexene-1-carboxylic-acid synthase [Cyanobacteria bacterium P01_F01_bin.53]